MNEGGKKLDLGFFEPDVLAKHRVIFFHAQLIRCRALVFRGCVEVARSLFGEKLDLNAVTFSCHDSLLD